MKVNDYQFERVARVFIPKSTPTGGFFPIFRGCNLSFYFET